VRHSKFARPMSLMGQPRRFRQRQHMSALPPIATEERTSRIGRFGPIADIRASWAIPIPDRAIDEDRMDTHKDHRVPPKRREEMVRAVVDEGMTRLAAALRYNTTPNTVAKWVGRFRVSGVDGLCDRSSRAHSSPSQAPVATCVAVEALWRQGHTGKQIAAALSLSPATVSRILRGRGLKKTEPVAIWVAVEALRRQGHTCKRIAAVLSLSPAAVSRILRRCALNKLSSPEPAEAACRHACERTAVTANQPQVCGSRTDILRRWQLLSPYLDRRQRSLWAAAEAAVIGRGGSVVLAGITGLSQGIIPERIRKLRLTEMAPAGSLRQPQRQLHGRLGRPRAEMKDPDIEPALEQMLSDEIAGDPMGRQRWVRSTLRSLSRRLKEQGHPAGTGTVARLLRKMGYSLQVMKKKQSGAQHPDRDEQFRYITALKKEFLAKGLPVISIDTKKKELIGNYRREGRSWRREPIEVESYFASYAQCVAVPFGIYDIGQNAGYVTVGISTNTTEFAVNSLANWWDLYGRRAYSHGKRLLIFADGGGGNGYNIRTWKKDLQERLCDPFGLTVTVSHYPPGCSKWNPVEYRLFSHISKNWAGQALRSLDAMLAFIRGTTTTVGLRVEARLDFGIYRKGRKATEKELRELALSTHDVCPRWNYTLSPRVARISGAKSGASLHFASLHGGYGKSGSSSPLGSLRGNG
jgi:transposase